MKNISVRRKGIFIFGYFSFGYFPSNPKTLSFVFCIASCNMFLWIPTQVIWDDCYPIKMKSTSINREIDTHELDHPPPHTELYLFVTRRHHHHPYRKLNLDSEKKRKKSLWKLIQCNWSSFEVILCRNDDGSRFSRVRLEEFSWQLYGISTRSVLFSFFFRRYPFFCRPT